MVRLLAILSVVASMMTLSVLGNPTFPGTCQVNGMTAPHGVAPATDKKFTVGIKLTTKAPKGNTYSVTIGGEGTFTGLLFYATDQATKARFGSFTSIPSAYSPLTSCKGENPKTNTLGHNSELEKPLPVTFTWTDAGHNAGNAWKGKFTGIIMTSEISTWYVLPPTAVTGGIAGTNTTVTTVAPAVSTNVVATKSSPSVTDTSSPPTPSGSDNTTSSDNTTIDNSSATNATLPASSAAHLSGSFVLCVLLSAFAITASL